MHYDESDILDYVIDHYELQELFDLLVVECNLTMEELVDAFEDIILSKRESFEEEMDDLNETD
jgi:hypothetical protein